MLQGITNLNEIELSGGSGEDLGDEDLGDEDFGPAAPTVLQKFNQGITDTTRYVENMTGVPRDIVWSIGVGVLVYLGYRMYNK
jgi:hypothetical protein